MEKIILRETVSEDVTSFQTPVSFWLLETASFESSGLKTAENLKDVLFDTFIFELSSQTNTHPLL